MLKFDISINEDEYFKHSHNQTEKNERSIELVLCFRYVDTLKGNLIEIGAITPYYRTISHHCLDPIDKKATIKDFAETYDFTDKNVLSISTIEHIGLGDYNLEKNEGLSYDVLCDLYQKSKTCLISLPIGYNKYLDDKIMSNLDEFEYFFYVRESMLIPLGRHTSWKLINDESGFNFTYNRNPKSANSVIFIIKGIEHGFSCTT